MGGIHPRIKRPVGRRLAYAAARQLKKQDEARRNPAQDSDTTLSAGAITGPTVAGCTAAATSVTLRFNTSLLGELSTKLPTA